MHQREQGLIFKKANLYIMAVGKIKDLYPPGNNGSQAGTGRIVEDGSGTVYSFQTPLAASVKLSTGLAVNFDLSADQVVTSIRQISGPASNSTL
jgi:hypothetical protein